MKLTSLAPAVLLAVLLPAAPVFADTFGSADNEFTIDFTTIGDAGNDPDVQTGYGAVDYAYRIGTYEVSRDMITKANTVGALGLTLADMSSFGGNGVDRPATGISWNEAARFVNWLNTSQGYSAAYNFEFQPGEGGYSANADILLWTALDGPAYDPANPFRNPEAYYFLPSEDEWYKAAYYDPDHGGVGVGGYWDYPTGSDTRTVATSGGTTAGTAIHRDFVNPTPPGPADIDNAGGLSAYGTMGQGGNAWEWGESGVIAPNDSAGESRVIRGGGWNFNSNNLASSARNNSNSPTFGSFLIGFRVASVPEPSGVLLSVLGLLGVAWRRKR